MPLIYSIVTLLSLTSAKTKPPKDKLTQAQKLYFYVPNLNKKTKFKKLSLEQKKQKELRQTIEILEEQKLLKLQTKEIWD